jgi:hypothetical protein
MRRTTHETHLRGHSAVEFAFKLVDADLAGQVYCKGLGDRNHARLARHLFGMAHLIYWEQLNTRVIVHEVVEPSRSHAITGDNTIAITRFAATCHHAGLDQVHNSVGDDVAMDTEIAPIREITQRLIWNAPQSDLHIPVIEKSKREDGSLSREDFTFDQDRNVYVCPHGKLLHTTGRIHDSDVLLYRARTSDCGPCPMKPKCCPKAPESKIPRSIHEDARDAARALVDTEAFEQSRRDRKRVEMLFAHLKRILRLGRLRATWRAR